MTNVQIVVLTILGCGAAYLAARLVCMAYFDAKFAYHLRLEQHLMKEGDRK